MSTKVYLHVLRQKGLHDTFVPLGILAIHAAYSSRAE